MAWIIDKRARLDGEIKKTKASLKIVEKLVSELSEIEKELSAIDHALALHEVHVDAELIPSIHNKYVFLKLPHGALTNALLLCLRLQEGDPISTLRILSFVEARHADLNVKPVKRSELRKAIQSRLKTLVKQGLIKRHHPMSFPRFFVFQASVFRPLFSVHAAS